jgi:peptide/nickel transport system permease protein
LLALIAKRFVGAAVIMVLLSVIIFMGGHSLLPGNEANILAGPKATAAQVQSIAHHLGLDRSIPSQYLTWLTHVLRWDFGVSPVSGERNSTVIAQQAPISLELGLYTMVIATVVGIPLGVLTASTKRKGADWGVRLPLLVTFAIPGFVSGSVLLYLVARYVPGLYSASYTPFSEYPIYNLRMMLVPALSVGIPTAALITQMTRSTMLEVLTQPHIATSRANGIPEWKIRYVYALKAALPPILTLEGFMFGLLIGNLFIVENIYSLPGLGRGVLDSIANRDFSLLEAQALVLALAFIVGNLVVDILVPLVDRRIVRR